MPELPEVESCRRLLEPLVTGREILSVRMARHNPVFLSSPATIARALRHRKINAIERMGKYLLFRVDAGGHLLLHLGMTGQIFSRPYKPDRHVHMTLKIRGLRQPVYFRDPRRFGKLAWLGRCPLESVPRLQLLGPDALEIDGGRLHTIARRRKVSIKAVLLDQSVFAGIGNIYADEALFKAGLRPGKGANRLTKAQAGKLAEAVRTVLERAIEMGGSSINDYIRPDGSEGYFQIEHQVYGRKDDDCRVCGAKIKRIVIAGRGTHYCPRCQQ